MKYVPAQMIQCTKNESGRTEGRGRNKEKNEREKKRNEFNNFNYSKTASAKAKAWMHLMKRQLRTTMEKVDTSQSEKRIVTAKDKMNMTNNN